MSDAKLPPLQEDENGDIAVPVVAKVAHRRSLSNSDDWSMFVVLGGTRDGLRKNETLQFHMTRSESGLEVLVEPEEGASFTLDIAHVCGDIALRMRRHVEEYGPGPLDQLPSSVG